MRRWRAAGSPARRSTPNRRCGLDPRSSVNVCRARTCQQKRALPAARLCHVLVQAKAPAPIMAAQAPTGALNMTTHLLQQLQGARPHRGFAPGATCRAPLRRRGLVAAQARPDRLEATLPQSSKTRLEHLFLAASVPPAAAAAQARGAPDQQPAGSERQHPVVPRSGCGATASPTTTKKKSAASWCAWSTWGTGCRSVRRRSPSSPRRPRRRRRRWTARRRRLQRCLACWAGCWR